MNDNEPIEVDEYQVEELQPGCKEKEGRDWLQQAMDLLKDQVRTVLGGQAQ